MAKIMCGGEQTGQDYFMVETPGSETDCYLCALVNGREQGVEILTRSLALILCQCWATMVPGLLGLTLKS